MKFSEKLGLDDLLSKTGEDLSRQRLPAEVFGRDDVFEAEIERIFGRTWVFLGHETEIPKNGDFMLRKIGTDSVIVNRDSTGTINVMLNHCPHRGTEICRTDMGNALRFTCPYHGWTFKANGDWVGAPHMGTAYKEIDKKQWGLIKAARVESFYGMIFANLDANAPALRESLGGAAWMIEAIMSLDPSGIEIMGPPDRWRVRTDWKNGAENFGGDNYHVHTAHGSAGEVGYMEGADNWGNYATQWNLGNGHVFCGGRLVDYYGPGFAYWGMPPEFVKLLDFSKLDDQQHQMVRDAPPLVGTIFPNLTFCAFGGSPDPENQEAGSYFSWRQWQPIAPGVTEIWSWLFTFKSFPDAYKRLSYDAGVNTFSSSGVFEQDDTVVWEGAARAGRSLMGRKSGMTFNYFLGAEGMSHYPLDPDWQGPGTRRMSGFGEQNQIAYYTRWHEEMTRAADGTPAKTEGR